MSRLNSNDIKDWTVREVPHHLETYREQVEEDSYT